MAMARKPTPLSASLAVGDAWLVDLHQRLITTHGIGNAPAVAADRSDRLALLVNILTRLEIRFHGDDARIRDALATPLSELDGRAPEELLAGNVATLRRLRDAVPHMAAPEVRMWRVGH